MGKEEGPLGIDALGKHAREVERCYDQAAGEGYRGTIGDADNREVVVSFFPDSGIAQVGTPLAHLTLRRAQLNLDQDNELLEIAGESEDEWTRAQINRNGVVVFASVPTDGDTPLSSSLFQREQSPEVQEVPEHAPSAEPERVELTGNLVKEPWFWTPKGTDAQFGGFGIGIHNQPGQTKYVRVRVTDKLVPKLRADNFQKGQLVTAVVYRRFQEQRNKETGELELKPSYTLGAPLRLAKRD